MAKVALGVTILASQTPLFLGREGLVGQILNPSVLSNTEEASLPSLITQCDLNQVDQLLEQTGENSGVSTLFQALKKTKGMSCENFLPWRETFHAGGTGYIDGIRPENMKESVMWGIDPWKRSFIAVKHTCDKVQEGALAFFQRYSDDGDPVALGGHFQLYSCAPSKYEWKKVEWLTDLFEKVVAQVKHLKGKEIELFLA